MLVQFPVFIYSLRDPITNEIKYVGRTRNPVYRHNLHIKNKENNPNKKKWIGDLLSKEVEPIMELLEIVPESEATFWEKYWISQCKTWGFNLLNLTHGGVEKYIHENVRIALKNCKNRGNKKGFRHTEETKQKIREKRALQVITEEHKRNISISHLGKKKTETHRTNISKGRKGIVFSEAHVNNIRKANLNKVKHKKEQI